MEENSNREERHPAGFNVKTRLYVCIDRWDKQNKEFQLFTVFVANISITNLPCDSEKYCPVLIE